MIVVLFGFVGLAVDGGRAYLDRRQAQSAVDAGALATADNFELSSNMVSAQQAGAAVFAANQGLYGVASASPSWCSSPLPSPPQTAPFPTCSATIQWSQDGGAHTLTLGWTDYRGAGKGLVISASTSHNLQLSFMQVLGVAPTISLGAGAQTVLFDQSQTPAILTLGRAPCNGTSGASLTVQGSAGLSVTVIGSIYSDGGITVGNNGTVNVAGNAYQNCGPVPINGISNPGYTQYTSVGPLSVNYLGGSALPVASNYAATQTWPAQNGNVEVFPGIYNSDPNLTGGTPCYFTDPGIYTFPSGLTDNKGQTSNELRPPDEPVYNTSTTHAGALSSGNPSSTADANYLQFWRNNGVTCDGTFNVMSVTSSGAGSHPLTPASSWGIEVTSARQDVYYPNNLTAVNYLRESSPSMCRTVSLNGSSAGFQVAVSNLPGAQWYNLYASPGGCGGSFGYVASLCDGTGGPGCSENVTMSNAKQSCPNLPVWSGSNPITAGAYQNNAPFSGSSGSCTLGFAVSQVFDSSNLSGFTPSGTACATVANAQSVPSPGCGPPDPELCPTSLGSCTTLVPNNVAGRNTPVGGDRADENQCNDATGAPATCPGSVTPGAVQLAFTNGSGSCLSVAGSGGLWLFSGKQYNYIAVYSVNSTCGGTNPNKINGGSGTTFIGTLYFPFTSITLAGGGQTAIATQVIALNCTIDGSAGVTVDYQPGFVPTPPSGRLVR